MRRTCRKILVALLAALVFAAGCGSDDEDDEIPAAEYKVLGGRLVWCAGTVESITVPDNASSIGNNAFKDCAILTKVVIPLSVTKIGTGTFFGVAVTEIEYKGDMAAWESLLAESGIAAAGFPAKITVRCTDGIWKPKPAAPATGDDPKPEEWQITPEGVLTKYTGNAADVTIPENVTAIGDGAFAGCAGITHVTIPGSVTSIGENAFEGCTSLAGIEIPASVGTIGAGAIPAGTTVTYHGTAERWDELAENAGLDGVTVFIVDESGTLTGYRGSGADITIPESVKGIAGGAFAGHAELEHIVIPAGVTDIAPGAFGGSGITAIEYRGDSSAWGELVEASGIAGELAGITVTCADGSWTPEHTHEWSETYADGGDGTHHRTCAGCGERSTAEEHAYGGTPQADGDSGHYQVCTAAGCGAQSETVPHGYTYTDNGNTHTMTCPDCAHTKTEAHAYGDETFTDAGHVKTCTTAGCSATKTEEHTWGETYADDGAGGHYRTCSVCGGKSEAEKHDCDATDNGDGMHTVTCTKCDYVKSGKHEYEDDICKVCECPNPATVYVRGTGSDTTGNGTKAKPFATIQKAVDTVITQNDGTSAYTIYLDGTLTQNAASGNGMADFSALNKNLKLTIKSLSGTATLDANTLSRVIYAKSSGALNLTLENLVIMGGKLESENGAGICFESAGGMLTMNGGEISGNIGSDEVRGGGVYVGNGGFIMNECAVSGNSTGRGAGIYVDSGGTFEMDGGTISKNNAIRVGGGFGGGVYVGSGEFTMNNGTIRENTATSNGGGVSIGSGGKFTMKGSTSTISDNNADGSGGGVCIAASGGTFTMEGGTISGNTATSEGGGVCNSDTFTMSGSASVLAGDEGKNDVYLAEGKTITVAGALTAATPVATITLPDSAYAAGTKVLSKGGSITTITQGICDKFALTTDEDWKIVSSADGTAGVLTTTTFYVRGNSAPWYASNVPEATASDDNSGTRKQPFATIQKAVDTVIAQNDSTSAYTIYVDGTLDGTTAAYIGTYGMADFSALNKKLTLTIKSLSETEKATLDGGARFDSNGNVTNAGIGKRIIYAKPASGSLNLTLENLTIKGGNATGNDNGGGIHFESSGGVLTVNGCEVLGNKAMHGGGVYVNNGTFTMESGTISGNTASNYGGGAFVKYCTFIIEDGTISGNTATVNGGGLYVFKDPTFTMKKGAITGNTAANGGGVYVSESTSKMEGGTISDCTATTDGGGVYVYSGTFTISGGEITGNTASSSGNGVYKTSTGTFTQTGGTVQSD